MKNLLIAGCGDIALRTIPLLQGRYCLYALVRNPAKAARLRTLGVTPLIADMDDRQSMGRISGIADIVLHFAPPKVEQPARSPLCKRGAEGGLVVLDTRTRNLLAALSIGNIPRKLVYISTSGVYGDCSGDVVDETQAVNPMSQRARSRVNAELQIREWAQAKQVNACILRVPGIYAAERLPLERLRAGAPAILAEQDSYSNHIHADDLARIVVAALRHAKPNRVYHAVDDDQMKMGDYFDTLADAYQLPRPPRLSRAEVQRVVSPMMWSFMNESRRLTNVRMKRELRVRLTYPSVKDWLRNRNF
jgi:nucleoside-diphosphate-sugar epimerase